MRRIVTLPCLLLIALLPLSGLAQNTISTIAGGGSPLAGTALTVSLGTPVGIMTQLAGNTYVSSLDGEYVYQIDGQNNVSILAGTGFAGFGGVGGPATSANLSGPAGLAFDNNGNLLIADVVNHHVYLVDLTTFVLTNVAGSTAAANPAGGFGGDGGPATQALLNGPEAVAVFTDALLNTTIYIADSANNRIRAVDVGTGNITTVAGDGSACPPSSLASCGDAGPATQASLNTPMGVAVDGLGDIFIADANANRVREVDTSGTITTVAGTGDPCPNPPGGCGDNGPATAATLNHPAALFFNSGSLLIADEFDQEVRVLDVGAQTISSIAGNGVMGFSGDTGQAGAASLSDPMGVFTDDSGFVVIADAGNNRIRQVDGNNNINTIVGGGTGGDGGPALSANFAQAGDIVLASGGKVLVVADVGTSRIRGVGPLVNTILGSGTAGYTDGVSPTVGTMNYPRGVTVNAAGNVFAADTANHAVRFISVDIVRGNTIATYAGNGTACSPSTAPCGDGGLATAANLNAPNAVAFNAAGDLFIADTGDNRIRVVDHTTLNISTLAGTGVACAVPTACGDGGPAAQAELNGPTGLAVDTAGNIFVADVGDNLIRKIDATTKVITTVAFNGLATFSGDGGPATSASMAGPSRVAVDPTGNLYISSGIDRVVRRVDAAAKTVITVAGNAQQPLSFGFSGDGGPATSATLDTLGLAINSTSGLYLADNNRIRFVQLAPTSVLAPLNLDFGNQAAGVGGTPIPVTLTNMGTDGLLISSIVDANGFSQTNNCPIAPVPLAPMQTCTINITFTPAATGAAADTLIITDNAAGSPHQVPLAGTGQQPFQVTTTCTSLSVVQGQSAIYTVDLAPFQGFTQSVSLSCSGAPALATCTVSPSAMTLDGATTVQAKVTASTTAATSGSLKSPFGRRDGNRMAGLAGLAGMAGLAALVILPVKGRGRHSRRLWALVFCLYMLASVGTMSSCGVGGGGVDPPGTAPGTYPLTVTATFQSAAGTTFTQNVSFDLVVK